MTDLVDAVLADHHTLARLLDDLAASGDARNRRDLVEQVIAELAGHWAAEEQVLYPAVRRLLPDGDAVADHELAAHARNEQTMKRLQQTDAATPWFDELVIRLVSDVRAHLRAEEHDVLPRLHAASAPDALTALGRRFELARKVSPTRPHPGAPATPPANRVTGPGMALVDRVRDAVSRRNT
ncbi:hemerythrin domain-containing protein [Actinophytocola sediminis]